MPRLNRKPRRSKDPAAYRERSNGPARRADPALCAVEHAGARNRNPDGESAPLQTPSSECFCEIQACPAAVHAPWPARSHAIFEPDPARESSRPSLGSGRVCRRDQGTACRSRPDRACCAFAVVGLGPGARRRFRSRAASGRRLDGRFYLFKPWPISLE
jgi:hypothetical protein